MFLVFYCIASCTNSTLTRNAWSKVTTSLFSKSWTLILSFEILLFSWRTALRLWFILRGDLFYVLPCVILFLCFSVLLALRLPRLGKTELILVLFVRLFDLCLFGFVGFLFLLVSGKGCGLWLWHSLDFSLTFFFTIENGARYLLGKCLKVICFEDKSVCMHIIPRTNLFRGW